MRRATSGVFNIQTISFLDPAGPQAFVRSLHETGFAVIRDHPITAARIDATYKKWGSWFKGTNKQPFLFDPNKQDGWFPMLSENAKGYNVKDLKEFYHVYPDGRVPAELESDTRQLYADLTGIGQTLLGWIQQASPPSVQNLFTEPLPKMVQDSKQTLLRILHYPPVKEGEIEPGAVRAAAHGDINLITVLVAGSAPGLEAQDTSGQWHSVPCDPGMIAINGGDMLEMASGGYFPATQHRVVNPDSTTNGERFSIPLFCHPRPEVVLRRQPRKTAKEFLHERLVEIGLKN